MALAAYTDVEAVLRRQLTDAEADYIVTMIEDASDLVIGYLGSEPDPVPDAVTRVVATMVAAVIDKPSTNTAQYEAGGYNSVRESAYVHLGQESATSTGPWLTNSLKERLSPFRASMVSVELHSEVAP